MSIKRIVIVNHVAELGGAERVLMDTLLHLDKEAFQVDMIFLEDGRLVETARSYGIRVHMFPSGRIRSPLHYWRTISFIRRVIRESGAEMVVSWAPKPHMYGGVAAWLEGKPSIWWQHGIPSGSMFDKVVSRIPAESVLCPSQSVREAQLTLTPNRRVEVNYPGIDQNRFAYSREVRTGIRQQYGMDEEAFVFAFIGRLQRWKRADVVIEAFREAFGEQSGEAPSPRTRPNVYLLIVGGALFGVDTDFEDQLKGMTAEYGLERQVIFAGHQQHVEHYLSACDAVVHSSLQEPFGMVVVEAMALGRPVLAVGKGGPAEIIRHGLDGYLYDGTAEELAQYMGRLYGDRALNSSLGEQARQTVDSRFTAGLMAGRFAHVVQERMVR